MDKIVSLYKQNKSIRQIARILHRGADIISKTLKKYNILIRRPQKGPINKKLLIKKYVLEKKGANTIAKEINRSQTTTLYWIKKYGIKIRKVTDYPSSTKGKKRPDNIIRNKLNSGKRHPFWGKKRPDHSKKMSGKNHPNWKGGITKRVDKLRNKNWRKLKVWRKNIFERDNYICQKCKKRGGDLESHHKKPVAKYPKLIILIENGLTLCKKCHKKETIKSIQNRWKEVKNLKVKLLSEV